MLAAFCFFSHRDHLSETGMQRNPLPSGWHYLMVGEIFWQGLLESQKPKEVLSQQFE